jgi:hypothetical protein
MPRLGSRQEASSKLLERLQQEASSAGVTLSGKEFVEPRRPMGIDGQPDAPSGFFDTATVRVVLARVSEKELYQWLHSVTEPRHFLGVTRLQLSPSGAGKTVNAEVEITQFYRESTPPKITRAP